MPKQARLYKGQRDTAGNVPGNQPENSPMCIELPPVWGYGG
eukprot:CAMPEP_0203878782 /NCGR_PEP_ID=MMETSP0359-20131031/23306_1 /ASSEMBLY_ACC=CAM_ASM_000338 /TAXON_ID=268821 /ORGANISM="Scrippsiella Hangoei, Strain SHTV-5" /LENGTH=40 /DNA_ID= /DNA_START= /DNA_END= /DNA_ORIENTATION=